MNWINIDGFLHNLDNATRVYPDPSGESINIEFGEKCFYLRLTDDTPGSRLFYDWLRYSQCDYTFGNHSARWDNATESPEAEPRNTYTEQLMDDLNLGDEVRYSWGVVGSVVGIVEAIDHEHHRVTILRKYGVTSEYETVDADKVVEITKKASKPEPKFAVGDVVTFPAMQNDCHVTKRFWDGFVWRYNIVDRLALTGYVSSSNIPETELSTPTPALTYADGQEVMLDDMVELRGGQHSEEFQVVLVRKNTVSSSSILLAHIDGEAEIVDTRLTNPKLYTLIRRAEAQEPSA